MNKRPLLITSNGFGMGHLVRQLAISQHFPDATILTLSGAAPLALANGARLEYCPSYRTPWISKRTWHRSYLKARIELLAREVDADVLVFDGVVPYIGLLNAIRELNLPSVWMRRGLWRESAATWPLKYGAEFDLVIEPGDIGQARDQGATRSLASSKVGVITEAGEMLARTEAAAALGVDPTKPTLLINVGSTGGFDLSGISLPEGWNVISTSDALGRNRSQGAFTKVSGLFPLHPYLSAVDLAVTSVGYNAAHEFVACGVPTIVLPSDNATDDQYARADAMVDLGVSTRAKTSSELIEQLRRWTSDQKMRCDAALKAKALSSQWSDGATEAARLISGAVRTKHSINARLIGRNAAEVLLGLLNRGKSTEALFTSELTPAMMKGDLRVEHLLAGTSENYAAARKKLSARY